MKEVMEFCSLGGQEGKFGKGCWWLKFESWRTVLCPETIGLDGFLALGMGREETLLSISHPQPPKGGGILPAHLESGAALGPNPPHRFISVTFHPFLPCFVPHGAQWRAQLYNSDNTKYSNKEKNPPNLIKILIATLKCFLWNYQSCQYPIINVQKSDYLFNKNREIPAFKLVIVAKQNAVIMHQNLGSQL